MFGILNDMEKKIRKHNYLYLNKHILYCIIHESQEVYHFFSLCHFF